MLPTLQEDWVVLVDPQAYTQSAIQVGDIVLARFQGHSTHPCVKRVAALEDSGAVLKGDNPSESTDSTTLGPVPVTDLLGKLVCTFP